MLLRRLWMPFGICAGKYGDLFARLWPLELTLRGGSMGAGTKFFGRPIIAKHPQSRIVLGDDVHIYSALRSNILGCFQPTVLRTLFAQSEIIIESNTGISAAVLCAAGSIHIGENVAIGAGAMILDSDIHHYLGDYRWGDVTPEMAKPVQIGRGVFVGARAIILKGVTIGNGAVVGAGAVVTKSVPDFHLAVGNPAQIRPLLRNEIPDH